MAASQLWYVPHRPDLVLLAPCDEEGPVPCPGSMYVSVDHMHPPPGAARQKSVKAPPQPQPQLEQQQPDHLAQPEAAAVPSGTSPSQPATSPSPSNAPAPDAASSSVSTKWKHPRATAFLTCYGDIGKQQPRVVRCGCGSKPCKLRDIQERGGVPDDLIPADWATKYELPPEGPEHAAPEGRRATACQLWLDCTNRAEKELPAAEGQETANEEDIKKAADEMLTDYLKGRVCFHCSLPSTHMQKCGRCHQARYCSRECQQSHWKDHKPECKPLGAAVSAASASKEPASEAAAAAAATPAEAAGVKDSAASASAAAKAPSETPTEEPTQASGVSGTAAEGPTAA